MILDLHSQGLSVSAIARQVGVDRKTVRTYIAKGLEPPAYKRPPAPSLESGNEPRPPAIGSETIYAFIYCASLRNPDSRNSWDFRLRAYSSPFQQFEGDHDLGQRSLQDIDPARPSI
jgi:hypothetical protein